VDFLLTGNSFGLESQRLCQRLSIQIEWGIQDGGNNSGSGTPSSGRGSTFSFVPNPPGAPNGRGSPLGYIITATLTLEGRISSDAAAVVQDDLDELRQEYIDMGKQSRPGRSSFSASGGTANFSWSELNGGFTDGNPHPPWGMVTQTLIDKLEATRTNYNRGGIRLSSGYRCPHGNRIVGGKPESHHIYGRAADMFSASYTWTEDEFNRLKAAADLTNPLESFFWNTYDDHHYHAAW